MIEQPISTIGYIQKHMYTHSLSSAWVSDYARCMMLLESMYSVELELVHHVRLPVRNHELIFQSLPLHPFHDSLVVVVSHSTAEVFVLHLRLTPPTSPQLCHLLGLHELEYSVLPVDPPDVVGIVVRTVEDVQQELPDLFLFSRLATWKETDNVYQSKFHWACLTKWNNLFAIINKKGKCFS